MAGQKVTVGCGHPVQDDGAYSALGTPDGLVLASHAGMTTTEIRLPRKRGRVTFPFPFRADVCFISAEQGRSDHCVGGTAEDDRCVKLVVALTEQGRIDIDERSRAVELTGLFGEPLAELKQAFGAQIVALDSPDASPPPGMVGIYSDTQTTVAAAVLRDGTRRFMRQDGELYSTNVPALASGGRVDSLF